MNKNNLIVLLATVAAILVVNYVVYAFSEPTSAPPGNNVPAPLNVGPQTQSKDGNLEINSLKARGGIDLGGIFRTTWPGDVSGGGVCTWEGTKCDCQADTSTISDVRLTLGLTCKSGQLTDFKIIRLDISSTSKKCSSTPPAGCTPSLYTYKND